MGQECQFLLFEGPESKAVAYRESDRLIRLYDIDLSEGLKVEQARELSQLLLGRSITDGSVVVMGPLDRVTVKAADALLKALEELPGGMGLIGWGVDLGNLQPALRSRSLIRYCPGLTGPPFEIEEAARLAVDVVRSKPWELQKLLEGVDPVGFCLSMAEIATSGDRLDLERWERARKVLRTPNPTRTDLFWVLLG